MKPHPAEHASRIAATYEVRHAETTPLRAAQDVMALLTSGALIIDLSDHDRRADIVLLRTDGAPDASDL
jgi:hypothetical protein